MTNQFPDQLLLLPLNDGINFVIGQDFRYITNSGRLLVAPRGFITDLASIPEIFWNIYDRWGVYGPACVIHDRNYWEQDCTREEADNWLLEGMVNLNTPNLTRFNIYHAVRMFGGAAWAERAKENKTTGYVKVLPDIMPKISLAIQGQLTNCID